MELGRALTFIVRVTSADAGEIAGTVERVRTGEKHRFTGLDGLGALIARIVTHEATPSASGSSEEPRPAGAARDQLGDGTARTSSRIAHWSPGADPDEEVDMTMYLTRFSYTPETWARMIQNPEDRRNAARSYIESVGGKLHGFWYAFGEHDGWNLWEAPDNVSMAAVALAIGSGGALSSIETTVLLTVEELLDALGKAKAVRYRRPGV